MKTRNYALLASIATLALSAGAANTDFAHYELILQKEIFGKAVAAPTTVTPTVTPAVAGPSWVVNYRLSMLVDEGKGQARAGLVNIRDNSVLLLGVGQSEDGITLLSVNLLEESAVFEKDGKRELVTINSGTPTPVTGGPAGGSSSALPASPFHRGRGRGFEPPTAPSAPVEPRLSGAELEAHLQNYQMEILRKGNMPPLPVALTPENDAALVKEGVLPALDAQGNPIQVDGPTDPPAP